MNRHQVEGSRKQLKHKVRKTWGKFSDEELDVSYGAGRQFIGELRERYGLNWEEAGKEPDGVRQNGNSGDNCYGAMNLIPKMNCSLLGSGVTRFSDTCILRGNSTHRFQSFRGLASL